jgi:hypothetical protein
MKHFNSTKSKYYHLFHVAVILTNFLHKHWIDFTYKVIGDQIKDQADDG